MTGPMLSTAHAEEILDDFIATNQSTAYKSGSAIQEGFLAYAPGERSQSVQISMFANIRMLQNNF